jgi:hypothetical protein
MMPFAPEFDVVYFELIAPMVAQFGLQSLRADQIFSSGVIVEQIRAAIQQSRLCVADVTGSNPNVLYEIGIAQTLGKPLILLARRGDALPFDIAHTRVIVYDPQALENARPILGSAIQSTLGEGRLEAAERLVQSGMYRAAVAMLAVILEHTFIQLLADQEGALPDGGTRPRTLGQMLQPLYRTKRITLKERNDLRRFIEIRNRAVHQLDEPTRGEAQDALSIVRSLLDRLDGQS